MDFFRRQEAARRLSRRLVALFAVAAVVVVAALDVVVLTLAASIGAGAPVLADGQWIASHPLVVLGVSGLLAGSMAAAGYYRHLGLREGGGVVALALGGEMVRPDAADPLQRRLRNVVEEMAIASGLPMPEVYVLVDEPGINAFAAGLNPADAAIAVTRGALEALDRPELQAVVAHEFSHILNGDMRLNTRLLAPLFGLTVLASAARVALHHLPRFAGRGRAGLAIGLGTVAAGMVMAIGSVGLFCGRLIQAAVSRHREWLADAAAVQFTRNPEGLRTALVKIGAASAGSRVAQPEAADIAHLLFAPVRRGAFATHPPLEARIRALDPHFDRAEFGAMRARLDARREATSPPQDGAAARSEAEALAQAGTMAAVPGAGEWSRRIGNPRPVHVEFAADLRRALPPKLRAASADAVTASAVLLALCLDQDAENRTAQMAFLARQLGEPLAGLVAQSVRATDALHVAQRLPLLAELMPALRRQPRAERYRLMRALHALLQREGARLSLHAYALRRLAHTCLLDELQPAGRPGRLGLEPLGAELAVLFAVLAAAGHEGGAADAAYGDGLGWLLGKPAPVRSVPPNWPARLDQALTRLDRLAPQAKARLIEALGRTVAWDGRLATREAELLRAICAVLHCPMPPLVAAA